MKADSRFLTEDAAQIIRGQTDHARGVLQRDPLLIAGPDMLDAAVDDIGMPHVWPGGEVFKHVLYNGEQPGGNRLKGRQGGKTFLPLPVQEKNLLPIHSVFCGGAGQKDQKLRNLSPDPADVAASRMEGGEKLRQIPSCFFLFSMGNRLQEGALLFKGIGSRNPVSLQLGNVGVDLPLEQVGALHLQKSVFSRNVVHKADRHKEQDGQLLHFFGRNLGNRKEEAADLFLCLRSQMHMLGKFAVDEILQFHHHEGADGDLGRAALLPDDGRDKAGQTEGTEIDVFSAEALGLDHPVMMRPDAVFLRKSCGTAETAASAARPVLEQNFPGGIGDGTAESGGSGKGAGTFVCQLVVKGFFFHLTMLHSQAGSCLFLHYEINFLVSQEKSTENYQKIRLNTSKEKSEWYNVRKRMPPDGGTGG